MLSRSRHNLSVALSLDPLSPTPLPTQSRRALPRACTVALEPITVLEPAHPLCQTAALGRATGLCLIAASTRHRYLALRLNGWTPLSSLVCANFPAYLPTQSPVLRSCTCESVAVQER